MGDTDSVDVELVGDNISIPSSGSTHSGEPETPKVSETSKHCKIPIQKSNCIWYSSLTFSVWLTLFTITSICMKHEFKPYI